MRWCIRQVVWCAVVAAVAMAERSVALTLASTTRYWVLRVEFTV
jgi:hypothetical protein